MHQVTPHSHTETISIWLRSFLLLLGYYYLIVAMFGIDAVARSRVSCLPFLFILAGIGIDNLLVRVGQPNFGDSLNSEPLPLKNPTERLID